ncbi:MAG: DUF21 domain-containing protein, partial [candidate division WOR-3 bacterium]
MTGYLIALVLMLLLSAVFSGSETALFSLSPTQLDIMKRSTSSTDRWIMRLLRDPNRLLGTLLLGNLIVNTSTSALFTLAAVALAGRPGRSPATYLGIGGLIMTMLLLIFGEVTPKLVATRTTAGFAKFGAPLVRATWWLLAPLVSLLLKLSPALSLIRSDSETLTDDELHSM